jgi:hypothetical protein
MRGSTREIPMVGFTIFYFLATKLQEAIKKIVV